MLRWPSLFFTSMIWVFINLVPFPRCDTSCFFVVPYTREISASESGARSVFALSLLYLVNGFYQMDGTVLVYREVRTFVHIHGCCVGISLFFLFFSPPLVIFSYHFPSHIAYI
ncbi:hypothetical protein M431DRAFT_430396 [Trichoderma harzianum CBS 226.95]|uniref:Secreted peptide n=1 Tax=Trichoderma harzianum CBS 226.95 TaxID=983964 RepID=A0A2T4ACR2_TRIHA|nr:hypothetical protein M431DRAFT_430396 [Trichoderma harzianum CBS 226.95]PTB54836.1 hypothetical protein M431DRAFT_430396 [Trichoderma harzianum CBS 226.95]